MINGFCRMGDVDTSYYRFSLDDIKCEFFPSVGIFGHVINCLNEIQQDLFTDVSHPTARDYVHPFGYFPRGGVEKLRPPRTLMVFPSFYLIFPPKAFSHPLSYFRFVKSCYMVEITWSRIQIREHVGS